MDWILYSAYGAIILVLVNAFFRANPMNLSLIPLLLLMAIPTTLGTQLFFCKSYQAAPNFHQAWFVGSILTAVTGTAASILIFGESFRASYIIGILLAMGGLWLLSR